jgi:aspartyl-tRNA(Asn)/glutamyl-tRNA(Gln) amidotransferase subunit A
MPTMTFSPAAPLQQLADALDAGTTTSRALVESALERIAAAGGDGAHAFIHVDADGVRRQADAQDALRRAGVRLSPLAGLPVSVKDLFDVAGETTRAGSRVLDDVAPATIDAPAVARLRRAGAVLIGRTNMSEFAFSGLGLNPWRGTPRSPWRDSADEKPRVAGGSSSGAAASVAQGMAAAGLGSDTGGSLRIPAAFCGLTGFKPTARRTPTAGMFPLSTTLDTTGAIAPGVACCALLDRVLSTPLAEDATRTTLDGVRLAVLSNYVTEGMDATVAQAWEAALTKLARAGARLVPVRLPLLDTLPTINRYGFRRSKRTRRTARACTRKPMPTIRACSRASVMAKPHAPPTISTCSPRAPPPSPRPAPRSRVSTPSSCPRCRSCRPPSTRWKPIPRISPRPMRSCCATRRL